MKNEIPRTFDGNMKKEDDVEAWLLGIKIFFRIHGYYDNMKANIATYSLKGKVEICWEHLRTVRAISEKELTWG